MKRLFFLITLAAIFSLSLVSKKEYSSVTTPIKIDTTAFVARHNYYRSEVGAPDIHWSDKLALYAQAWADKLSKTCNLQHSNGKYGENIYWTSSSKDEVGVVDSWASEKHYFNHKDPTYIHSKSGHYSQVIWANSKWLGAGAANCKGGGQIWVCVYDPAGNVVGEKAY